MLERARFWLLPVAAIVGACAAPSPQVERPQPPAAAAAPVAPSPAAPARDEAALEAEAKAMLAQAETDVQRARAKRALWLRAWEELLAAREAASARDHAAEIRHARSASELAELGLEQLAYPAVR